MKSWPFLVALACLFGGTGCGLLGTAAERKASLTVANHSNWTICSIQVAPHTAAPSGRHAAADSFDSLDGPSWSADLLGEAVIQPGYAYTVPVRAGRWDVRMDDCRARALYARRSVLISGASSIEFRPIRVERPTVFSRRRVADAPRRSRAY